MNTNLNPNPEVPEEVKKVADEDAPIIPITVNYVGGDVVYQGYKSQSLIDMGHNGEHDLVFDVVSQSVNRFAIHYEQGSEFVVGWLYDKVEQNDSSWDGLAVHLREDVEKGYANENYPDEPSEINEIYGINYN